jgi:hypothetical protein
MHSLNNVQDNNLYRDDEIFSSVCPSVRIFNLDNSGKKFSKFGMKLV